MKIIIWGAGLRGQRLHNILSPEHIAAYIDSDIHKIGKRYKEIPIISYEEYKDKFNNYPILVCPQFYEEICTELRKDGIYHYWILSHEPMDMYDFSERPLRDLFDEIFSKYDQVAIKGTSLYSVFLYNYFISKNKEAIHVFEKEDRYVEIIRQIFKHNILHFQSVHLENFKTVLNCDENIDEKNKDENEVTWVNAIDNLKKTKKNYSERLNKFKSIHKGNRCFIIGNGPSLTMEDLDKLNVNKEFSFGVNGIIKSQSKTQWRPDYYIISDVYYADTEYEDYLQYDVQNRFVLDGAKEFWKQILPDNVYKFHCTTDYSSVNMNVSDDICYGVYIGKTVIHACIQFAIYMGFNEIYLLGTDTTAYKSNENNHFIENYYGEKNLKVDKKPYLDIDRVLTGYKAIKKFAEKNNVKIYNATRGGALEIFERVNFDHLFVK